MNYIRLVWIWQLYELSIVLDECGFIGVDQQKHPACRPCTDLWDCNVYHLNSFDTAWHWPGLQSPINCISDALGWLLRSHHRVSPPCFNLRQDEGSRWWDQKVQRWMWHVRSCQIMSDHSGSRELCICRQVICDALQVQRKHHGEDRVWRTVSRRQPELPQHFHDLLLILLILLIADRLGVFCVESIVFKCFLIHQRHCAKHLNLTWSWCLKCVEMCRNVRIKYIINDEQRCKRRCRIMPNRFPGTEQMVIQAAATRLVDGSFEICPAAHWHTFYQAS